MPVKKRRTAVRLVGTKVEICSILAAFKDKGFTWRSNEHFYPRIGQSEMYSYYMEDFHPTAPTA